MSILGKILAILNVFAVIGAIVLLAQDYAKREAWAYAVFREDLVINGLPLDDRERDPQGQLLTEKIGEKTQKELFPTNPIKTQKEEVARVERLIRGKIDGAGDKKKQIVMLAQILSPLIVSNEQREQMIAYETYLRDDPAFERLKGILQRADRAARQPAAKPRSFDEGFRDALAYQHTDPTGPFADAYLNVLTANPNTPFEQALDQSLDAQLAQLRGQLDQHFKAAQTDTDAPDQRKRNIARLLFNVTEALIEQPAGGAAKLDLLDTPEYKRFVTVVGVREAVGAVNDEARILGDIIAELKTERLRERSKFALQHGRVIAMIQDKAADVQAHTQQRNRQQTELDAHNEDLKKRELDVKFYQEQLGTVRKDTAERLKELQGMSAELHKLRVKLRDDTVENQKLEKQIRTLEEGR